MTYCVRFAMPKRKRTTQRARDSENARRRGKVKVKTISDFTWHKLSVKEKFDREPIGSVYLLKSTARAQQVQLEMCTGERFRLEWGSKNNNYRGTVTVHGTPEQARALMTYAYRTLRISETKPHKSVVQEFIRSFCTKIAHPENDSVMWQIVKDIPESSSVPSQYERAQLFLRTLLIRTLRNIYPRATVEEIV